MADITAEIMKVYLLLEEAMMVSDDAKLRHGDAIRDIMDPVWHSLPDDALTDLNQRSDVAPLPIMSENFLKSFEKQAYEGGSSWTKIEGAHLLQMVAEIRWLRYSLLRNENHRREDVKRS